MTTGFTNLAPASDSSPTLTANRKRPLLSEYSQLQILLPDLYLRRTRRLTISRDMS
jgi:hypothetical protein